MPFDVQSEDEENSHEGTSSPSHCMVDTCSKHWATVLTAPSKNGTGTKRRLMTEKNEIVAEHNVPLSVQPQL